MSASPAENRSRRIDGAGDAKNSALARIESAMSEAAAAKAADTLHLVAKSLKKAIRAYHKSDWRDAALNAASAAELDPTSASAFHLLALALDNLGQMVTAIQMYEKALALDPSDADLYLNVGLAAWKMDMLPAAERAFRLYIELRPDCHKGYNNLGGCLRDLGRMDEAVDLVRNAIYRIPNISELWNTLGTIMGEASDFANSVTFYREALRIDPRMARGWHNLAYALNHTGPLDEALECYDRALKLNVEDNGAPADRVEMTHARGLCAVALGRLKEGWIDYEARLDPHYGQSVLFAVNAPRWDGEDLTAKKLLLIGEQGLGDEIMFAEMVPELIERAGPNGKIMLACDHRLVSLFARSFPQAHVGPQYNAKQGFRNVRLVPWAKDDLQADIYAPCATPLQYLRPTIDTFNVTRPFLAADPEKIAQWRQRLDALGPGLKIGICWRSMMLNTQRKKFFAALDLWAPVLKTSGAQFVNLQYGDCRAELEDARTRLGVRIAHFDDLDLKNDLDGNAALCASLDLVLSAPTAAAALAAAVGAETWFLVAGSGWPQMGKNTYPWYPNTRVIAPETFGDWPAVMATLKSDLETRVASSQ
jgi:tetratricopeptide (TPR) repeat protein